MENTLFTALSANEEANLSGGISYTYKYNTSKKITLTGGSGGKGGDGGKGGPGIDNTGKGSVTVKDKGTVTGGVGGRGGYGGDGAPAFTNDY
ncbi:MAG: hypothetical protein V7L04_10425 [Nostoc sp.]|uniref:hypothetical protein n=1 Tax=Nostoc sp. TaxID=1180 RepID=UPI002FF81AF8